MINHPDKSDASGQSLIELVVVLPLLLLFISVIFPILSSGVVTPWLDERLWLRQFIQEKETIQSELEDTHIKNLIPLYFGKNGLEETTDLKNLGIALPIINDSYPGHVKIQRVLASHPEEKGAVFPGNYRSDEKISRKLAMLVSSTPADYDISSRIRKLTVLGTFPWKIGVLESMDFELFHLNLDALPDAK